MTNNGIERAIGRLEGKMDSLIVDLKLLREGSKGAEKDLGGRVVKLEKRQFTIVILATLFWSGMLAFAKKWI